MTDDAIALHLTQAHPAFVRSTFDWLPRLEIAWTTCASLFLVVHHLFETLVALDTNENVGLDHLACHARNQTLLATFGKPIRLENVTQYLFVDGMMRRTIRKPRC